MTSYHVQDPQKQQQESYPPHLSEFYSIFNNNSSNSSNNNNIRTDEANNIRETSNNNYRRTASLNSNVSTSTLKDLEILITKRDMSNTLKSINEISHSSKKLINSLSNVSNDFNSFASSIENLSRLKGCDYQNSENLLNASGLFYLLSNVQNIMATTIENFFSHNLTDILGIFQSELDLLDIDFKKNCKKQAEKLKLQEKLSKKFTKNKMRNIFSYRENLSNLQSQLDEFESLKINYYQNSFSLVDKTISSILTVIASLSKAQIELSENIAKKGWSGNGLDSLLSQANDPFTKQDNHEDEHQLRKTETDESQIDENDPFRSSRLSAEQDLMNSTNHLLKPKIDSQTNSIVTLLNAPIAASIPSSDHHDSVSGNNNSREDNNSSAKSIAVNNNNEPKADLDNEAEDNSFSLPKLSVLEGLVTKTPAGGSKVMSGASILAKNKSLEQIHNNDNFLQKLNEHLETTKNESQENLSPNINQTESNNEDINPETSSISKNNVPDEENGIENSGNNSSTEITENNNHNTSNDFLDIPATTEDSISNGPNNIAITNTNGTAYTDTTAAADLIQLTEGNTSNDDQDSSDDDGTTQTSINEEHSIDNNNETENDIDETIPADENSQEAAA